MIHRDRLKFLKKSVNIVGLKIKGRKTKTTELLDTVANITDPEEWTYEKINEFQYIDVCLNTKHNKSRDIGVKAERS